MYASLFRGPLCRKATGFTLLETCVALMLVGIFVSMLMVMTSNVLGLLRAGKDDISVTQALQERVEQMRIANWLQITDSAYIAGELLGSATGSADSVAQAIETITISAYPEKTGSSAVKVMRQNNAVLVVSSNAALKNERMVRVDVELKWRGYPHLRPRARATTALIAKGGITK